MPLLSSLSAPLFIAAFLTGMVVCYFVTPPPQVVVKFPTPHTAGKTVYRDASDTCFVYRAEKQAACPRDGTPVLDQPITEEFRRAGRSA